MNKFLILAGMPCSGKSTLLRRALINGNSLFGKSNDDVFFSTKIPHECIENTLFVRDRLKNNYWLHEWDLIDAKHENLETGSRVAHFDIYYIYMTAISQIFNYSNIDEDNLKKIVEFTRKKI